MKTSEFSAPMPEDIARVLSETVATPIQTRGPLQGRRGQVRGPDLPLGDLIAELRKAVLFFPLTFVIHDWGTEQTADFVKELRPLLNDQDGLWLISGQQRGERGSGSEAALGVELVPTDGTDERLYRTLMGDMVFFAGRKTDIKQITVDAWANRARVVVVDREGPRSGAMIKKAKSLRLVTYQRNRYGRLIES